MLLRIIQIVSIVALLTAIGFFLSFASTGFFAHAMTGAVIGSSGPPAYLLIIAVFSGITASLCSIILHDKTLHKTSQ